MSTDCLCDEQIIVSWDGKAYSVERKHWCKKDSEPIPYAEWYGDFRPSWDRNVDLSYDRKMLRHRSDAYV